MEKSIRFDETIVEDSEEIMTDKEADKTVDEAGIVEMHFMIQNYLPIDSGIQKSFELIIGGICFCISIIGILVLPRNTESGVP